LQSPEGRMIFYGLTVEENLRVGAYSLRPEFRTVIENDIETTIKISVKQQVQEMLEVVYNYFPILGERKKQQASTLSGGEQQMLAIGRALMGKPKLLLLDEPSLGLAPLIVRSIFDIIQKIKESGRTILIVEQNAYQTLKIADYAYLLELGLVKKQGSGQELLNDEELVNAYLGTKK
jgi:branched-chain amino acid transport system ATP-binding protein